MDLSAFTVKDRQHCRALLEQAQADGLDLAGLLALLPAPAPPVATMQPSVSPCPTIRPDGTPCPGRLAPVANRDGLRILGCRLCRYSEVVP